MKRLLETLAQGLVEQKGRVRVTESTTGDEVRLELSVAAADKGRVIGKGGRTADALRALLGAAARARGQRVVLEVRT